MRWIFPIEYVLTIFIDKYRWKYSICITLRLQRLFISLKTIEHITWHHSHDAVDRMMVHPSDDEVWKHFNMVHLWYSMKSRNVCIGLYTYRSNLFMLFVTLYFCWPVILTIYNLLLRMLIRLKFIILFTILIIRVKI